MTAVCVCAHARVCMHACMCVFTADVSGHCTQAMLRLLPRANNSNPHAGRPLAYWKYVVPASLTSPWYLTRDPKPSATPVLCYWSHSHTTPSAVVSTEQLVCYFLAHPPDATLQRHSQNGAWTKPALGQPSSAT